MKNDFVLEKKIIWLYIILLIIEGGLRKWIFPTLSTPLLVIRDPLVLMLVYLGLKKGLINNSYSKVSIIISFISILVSLTIPSEKLPVIIFGARIFLLYFPAIFIVSIILTKEDLYKICRFFIYVSIPMTIIVILQYYSPQTSFINRGVGGNIEGSGFGGAMGYYRPSGIFSFTQGYVMFQSFIFTFILLYKFVKEPQLTVPINRNIINLAFGMFLVTIPLSISRALLFQVIIIFLFLLLGIIFTKKSKKNFFTFVLSLSFIILVLLQFEQFQLLLKVFETRFINAESSEGNVIEGTIGNRWFGAMIRPWNLDVPLFGNGIGTGTRVGLSFIPSKTITDEDWTRIIYESGYILGGIYILLRLFLTFEILVRSIRKFTKTKDIQLLLFLPLMLFQLPQGPLGGTVPLGFTLLSVAFSIIVLKK